MHFSGEEGNNTLIGEGKMRVSGRERTTDVWGTIRTTDVWGTVHVLRKVTNSREFAEGRFPINNYLGVQNTI